MKIKSFTVLPELPSKLKKLKELAHNMYFSWHHDTLELFKKLDPEIWVDAHDNPVRMLCLVAQEKLEEAATDELYQAQLAAAYDRFQSYKKATRWFERNYGKFGKHVIAYFSAEFAIHECIPIYSGGLGVLAGDHVKSSSDLGVPLVGVSLLYSQGYFRQYLNSDGLQQEYYPESDWYLKPVSLVKDKKGIPLKGTINLAGDTVYFHIWQIDVGCSPIFLLDTNINENPPEYQAITRTLYDPDKTIRIWQELLLGIGGVRALKILGYSPEVFHINEGHSAFLLLERMCGLMKEKHLTFQEAKNIVWTSSVFTTHTPVPEGNETFSLELVEKYMKPYIKGLRISWEEIKKLGYVLDEHETKQFSMTAFALHCAAYANGVSQLHGYVARDMWQKLYPDIPKDEIPIGAIVNGVHARTWLSKKIINLFMKHGGLDSFVELTELNIWNVIDEISNEELWEVHEANRCRLVEYSQRRLVKYYKKRGAYVVSNNEFNDILDPEVLTIGFARRFADYKRGFLLFRDIERLKQILLNEEHPVQIIIAGKAHPADTLGKEIIKKIFDIAQMEEFKRRVVFLEDYDLEVASYLVQGVDLWLNNPRRPLEACGTSGMKAAINGALNLSLLDGWWDEAYSPEVGWVIGGREQHDDPDVQDQMDSDLLYTTLERDIVPLFYERDDDGIPQAWVAMMKNSIRDLGMKFNSHRMVEEYAKTYYLPAASLHQRLKANEYKEGKALATWRKKITTHWKDIKILSVDPEEDNFIYKGHTMTVQAKVQLGLVKSENVIVECCYGILDGEYKITNYERVRMDVKEANKHEVIFNTSIPCSRGGHYGYAIRILPGHPNLAVNFLPELIKWYE